MDSGRDEFDVDVLRRIDEPVFMDIQPLRPSDGLDVTPVRVEFRELRIANLRRCGLFHATGIHEWHPARWAGCVCGEVGEVFNARKKVWRGDGTVRDVLEELADVAIYADLLMASVNCRWDGLVLSMDQHVQRYMSTLKPIHCTQNELFRLMLREATFAYQHALLREPRAVGGCALDVMTRAMMLMFVLGESADRVIARKFNATSRERGFDILIGGGV
jgi:NTP pyrophosphatase (non-canonical NTP hydrolase)